MKHVITCIRAAYSNKHFLLETKVINFFFTLETPSVKVSLREKVTILTLVYICSVQQKDKIVKIDQDRKIKIEGRHCLDDQMWACPAMSVHQ